MPSSIRSSNDRFTLVAVSVALAFGSARAQSPSLPGDAPTTVRGGLVRPASTLLSDPEQTARARTEKGQRAYDLGRFEEAMSHYAAAYEAMPLPAMLFNIGQCHRHLGDYERAAFFYRRYLDLAPDAANAPLTRELLEEVQRLRTEGGSAGPDTPLLRRWWFWAGAGALVLGTGGAVWFATRPAPPTLGTVDGR